MPRCCRFLLVAVGALALIGTSGDFGRAQPPPPAPDQEFERATEPSPLLREPKTPEEMFSAVLLMVDLARLDLADRYLKQFLDTDPDDELLIRLRDKHGTGEFLKLSRIKELRGLAQGLLEKLSAASRKQAEDPAYAQTLIARLGSKPTQRELAIRELRNLGEAAVGPLLHQLVTPTSAAQTDQIVIALSRIGQPAVAPTVAALQAPEPSVRLSALAALKLLKSPAAAPYLWAPAFIPGNTEVQRAAQDALERTLSGEENRPARISAELAANELRRISRGLYFRQYELPLDDDGMVVIWSWDDEAGTAVRRTMPLEQAQLYRATQFARQALELSPENKELQQTYLGCLLGWSVAENGRDLPVDLSPGSPGYTALSAGEQTVTDVLAEALAAGQSGTAQAALQILGQVGSHEMILGGQGRKSPVIAALNYPDLRVQFAAANTLLRLEPNQPFRGADRVVSILQRAVTNTDDSKALIIDADNSRAEVTAGYLSDLGYTPIMVRTGKEGFVAASTTAGIEFAIVDINCIRWDLSQTVANFRADARTAYLPLVFYGPENIRDVRSKTGRTDAMAFPESGSTIWNGTLPPGGRMDPLESTTRRKLRRLILDNGPAMFVAESGSASDFAEQLQPFLAGIKGAQLTESERAQYQAAAVRWLAHLSQADKGDVFDLAPTEASLSELLDRRELAPMAVVALSGIPSNTVQRRFAVTAGNAQEPAALRTQTANQLAFHIQRHGAMLTEDEVRALQTAWKNETDPMVASALAAVIGSLQPEAKAVTDRIGRLPAPR